jgi:hypothetical protein
MRGRTGIVTLCLILFGVFSVPATAQDDQKAFASVPDAVRTRLIERFRLLVIYETGEQWDREYDLLESRYAKGKEEYVAQRHRNSANSATKWIFAFIAETTEDVSGSDLQADYKVVGYAKVKERGCLVKRKGFAYAFLRNGDWYFSGFIVELPTSHAPPAPCVS